MTDNENPTPLPDTPIATDDTDVIEWTPEHPLTIGVSVAQTRLRFQYVQSQRPEMTSEDVMIVLVGELIGAMSFVRRGDIEQRAGYIRALVAVVALQGGEVVVPKETFTLLDAKQASLAIRDEGPQVRYGCTAFDEMGVKRVLGIKSSEERTRSGIVLLKP